LPGFCGVFISNFGGRAYYTSSYSVTAEADGRGRMAREAYDEWFATPKVFNNIIAAYERIRANRRISERWVQPFWGLMLWRARVIASIRKLGKNTILWMFKILGKRFVYEMNTR
jgi:hypothetical protein